MCKNFMKSHMDSWNGIKATYSGFYSMTLDQKNQITRKIYVQKFYEVSVLR